MSHEFQSSKQSHTRINKDLVPFRNLRGSFRWASSQHWRRCRDTQTTNLLRYQNTDISKHHTTQSTFGLVATGLFVPGQTMGPTATCRINSRQGLTLFLPPLCYLHHQHIYISYHKTCQLNLLYPLCHLSAAKKWASTRHSVSQDSFQVCTWVLTVTSRT